MNRVLLTGAGFSRNWGGWLASEISNRLLEAVNRSPDKSVIDSYYDGLSQENGNYETVLCGFQRLYQSAPAKHEGALRFIEDSICECFFDMDKFYQGKSAGISDDATYNVEVFLAHFDSIFTTNQDRLVESLFANLFTPLGYSRTDKRHRFGLTLPGVIGTPTLPQLSG